jgi:hypothetical protein
VAWASVESEKKRKKQEKKKVRIRQQELKILFITDNSYLSGITAIINTEHFF